MGLSLKTESIMVGVLSVIIGTVAGSLGIIALQQSIPVAGLPLIGFGILAFGWACFARKDFYGKKKIQQRET